ncbi:MAG: cobalamin-binding protein [Burkholderiales bacterium]|nr:cobalamin-binding protein [Burkholderiales bacterium]
MGAGEARVWFRAAMVITGKRRWACLGLAAVLGSVNLDASGGVAAVDDSGLNVQLAQPARRIVTLAPHLTELVFAAGAGGAIVGADAYSDYPAAARAITRIGDAHALDLERIVALRPDLIVAWSSGSPQRQLARLRALGLSVFQNEPRDLDAIAGAIERLGVLAGTEAVAREHAADFRRELARIRADYGHAPLLRVFYQVADRPLVTVSGRHLIADALRACSAINVFGADRHWLPRPSREAVLLADPDAIVVADVPGGADALAPWRRWASLRAVRTQRLLTVDPSTLHRASPRMLVGVESLCLQLHANSSAATVRGVARNPL